MEFIANTNKQELSRHLKAIAYLSRKIYENLGYKNNENYENMRKACYLAGLFHDFGKIDPEFQEFIKGKKIGDINSSQQDIEKADEKTWDHFVRHNEISWLICTNISKVSSDRGYPLFIKGLPGITDLILYSVYWHHAEKIREKNFTGNEFLKTLGSKRIDQIFDSLSKLLEKLNGSCEYEFFTEYNKEISIPENPPNFKSLNTVLDTNNTIVRCCVIEADRAISALNSTELDKLFDLNGRIKSENFNEWYSSYFHRESHSLFDLNNLCDSIDKKINLLNNPKENKDFDTERDSIQENISEQLKSNLFKKGFAILQGPAGVGKTIVSLRTADKCKVKKIVFVCPRVQVCMQNYTSISEDLPEITTQIFTGEHKINKNKGNEKEITDNEFMNAEVVVTTIDQIASLFLNHVKATKLLDLLSTSTLIVFDEFHELMSLPGLFYSFKELVTLKGNIDRDLNSCGGVLFMSATPNPIFLMEALSNLRSPNEVMNNITKMRSFNKKPFAFKLTKNENDINQPANSGEIVIYNLVKELQQSVVKNNERNSVIVFHSKFTPNDQKKIFEEIVFEFGKLNSKNKKTLALRAGPIIQASLDISTEHLITQETCPEDLLQRVGRCNRWAYLDNARVTIVLHEKNEKETNVKSAGHRLYLKKNFCLNRTISFTKFLINKKGEEFVIDINELYDIYFEFVNQSKEKYQQDINEFLEEAKIIQESNQYFRPIEFFDKAKQKLLKKNKNLPKTSLRGSSIYALPVRVTWNHSLKKFSYQKKNNEFSWLWSPVQLAKDIENNIEINKGNLLTLSTEEYFLNAANTNSLLVKFQQRITKKGCGATALYPSDSFTKYNSRNQYHILTRCRNPTTPILISDPENIYSFGYELNDDQMNDEQSEAVQNFGYDFEYDKNISRYVGLGLVDINQIHNF